MASYWGTTPFDRVFANLVNLINLLIRIYESKGVEVAVNMNYENHTFKLSGDTEAVKHINKLIDRHYSGFVIPYKHEST